MAAKTGADDLTRAKIPGGVARFYTPRELPNRRRRELDAYNIALMPKMRRLLIAQRVISADGETLDEGALQSGLVEGLSPVEARQFIEMNDVAAWAYLKSWNLTKGGLARPLPVDVDDMIDNFPGDLVDALVGHAAKIIANSVANPGSGDEAFTEAAIGDEASPSTASDE